MLVVSRLRPFICIDFRFVLSK